MPDPVTLPQELIDQLSAAEVALQEAKADDQVHDTAAAALLVAIEAEKNTALAALKAHGTSNEAATAFIEAIKAHFGLT